MNVADLKAGELDSAGVPVLHLYARKAPDYAVYQTSQRVAVHFADAIEKSNEQRKVMAQLAPLRGELNGLIDGWREAPDEWRLLGFIRLKNGVKLRKRAERYDRRVSDGLTVALEGDLTGAGAVLQEIKEDVLAERVGLSRFEYLLTAVAVAAVFIFISSVIAFIAERSACTVGRSPLCFNNANDLWRGAMAGALGSFFSIALAIRGRTVLTDLLRTNNLMDAALRVAIGITAGFVLVALVLSKFVHLSFGDSSGDYVTDLSIAITGFVAGFAERLVPDLLATATANAGEKPVLRRPESTLVAKPDPAAATAAADTKQPTAAAEEDPASFHSNEDGCVADVELTDEEMTPDDALPAASGGIALQTEKAAA